MNNTTASNLFEALSSDIRLSLFRLLVKNAPGGLVAGDAARELGIPANNLSFHLKALVYSGLADVEKRGRFMLYRANIPLMLELIAYLTEECCSGDPAVCQKYRDASGVAEHYLPGRRGRGE